MRSARLLSLLVGAVLVAACQPGAATQIVLGAVYNTTGAQAVLDVPSLHGSSLAVEQINSAGGVLGDDLALVQVDGDTQPQTLGAGVQTTLADHPEVLAFLGLSDTDMVLAAVPPATAAGRVFVTSGATSPKLPAELGGQLFLACFGDNVQAAAGAEWAYDSLGARSALVLYDPNVTYTDLLQRYFTDRFEALGGSVTSATRIDPRAASVQIPSVSAADLVFLSVQTADDAARVAPLLRAAGYAGPILGGDGYDAESVWSEAPDLDDIYFTTHVYLGADSPRQSVRDFVDAYAQAYPGEAPTAFSALGYDAVGLLAAAIERAGEASAAKVHDGLAGLTGYAGVTGTISYPDGSQIPTKSVTILRVTDGSQQFVAEVLPREVPAP